MAKKEKDAAKRAQNLKQQENKTPEFAAAKKAFEQYFKDNNLDPTKDYTGDPKHGKKVTKLLAKLNKERDKLAAKYPESDKGAMERLKKKADKKASNEAKVDKLQKHLKKEKEGAKKVKKPTKYDYPLIEGREMTSAEKKKYRMEQRKLKANSILKENQTSAEPKKSKKKDKVVNEPDSKVKKNKKKVQKEED